MIAITTTLVYQDGVLHPTEKVDLSEHRTYRAVLLPVSEQDSLNDVLGFDPNNEQVVGDIIKKQQQALLNFTGLATTSETDDASLKHDKYLYGHNP
jgi:predicted DNA-binding antitoxin AbrB/MazE fold protein